MVLRPWRQRWRETTTRPRSSPQAKGRRRVRERSSRHAGGSAEGSPRLQHVLAAVRVGRRPTHPVPARAWPLAEAPSAAPAQPLTDDALTEGRRVVTEDGLHGVIQRVQRVTNRGGALLIDKQLKADSGLLLMDWAALRRADRAAGCPRRALWPRAPEPRRRVVAAPGPLRRGSGGPAHRRGGGLGRGRRRAGAPGRTGVAHPRRAAEPGPDVARGEPDGGGDLRPGA